MNAIVPLKALPFFVDQSQIHLLTPLQVSKVAILEIGWGVKLNRSCYARSLCVASLKRATASQLRRTHAMCACLQPRIQRFRNPNGMYEKEKHQIKNQNRTEPNRSRSNRDQYQNPRDKIGRVEQAKLLEMITRDRGTTRRFHGGSSWKARKPSE